jgi:RNA polymerase sigma factor (sigma-70 family)
MVTTAIDQRGVLGGPANGGNPALRERAAAILHPSGCRGPYEAGLDSVQVIDNELLGLKSSSFGKFEGFCCCLVYPNEVTIALAGDAPNTAAAVFTSPLPDPTATEVWERVISLVDHSAFEMLFYGQRFRFWGRAHDYIRHAFSLTDIAEDLATDATVKAFMARKTFDAAKGRFESWFWQIVNNTVRDYLKSAAHKHEVQILADHESILDERANDEREGQGRALLFAQLLKCPQLSEANLQILILSREGLTPQEIASTLDLEPERVYQLKFEAIRKLRLYFVNLAARKICRPPVRKSRGDNWTQIEGEL